MDRNAEKRSRQADKRKVVKYRKQRKINVGILVFVAILLYLTVSIFVYLTRDKVNIYEVVKGKNASITNKSHTGLILRDESVAYADASGYLNYFVKQGDRVSKTSTVYAIDESGTISSLLSNASENGEVIFEDQDEQNFRNIVADYTSSKSDIDFSDIYDFKMNLSTTIMECININTIQTLMNSSNTTGFKIHQAENTGIAALYSDGYESKTEETLTSADFDTANYSKKSYQTGDLIQSGSVAYKVANTENWSMYFPIDSDELKKYQSYSAMTIKSLKDNRQLSGNFTIIFIEGQAYGKISMIRYMSSYIDDRFMDFQIVESSVSGLKIPRSSVVEKKFFTIPIEYAGNGGAGNELGFYKKVYDDNNNESIKFVTPTIYSVNSEYYYVDASDSSDLSEGDYIIMPDSTDTYRVAATGSLNGVYNVNNGYCIFRNVDIIAETGDYFLVDDNTPYGLKVYDHIVINAYLVEENQVVFSVQ